MAYSLNVDYESATLTFTFIALYGMWFLISGDHEIRMIGAALAHWEKETCLKFEKYDANKHGGFERMQKNNLQLVQFTAIQDGYV